MYRGPYLHYPYPKNLIAYVVGNTRVLDTPFGDKQIAELDSLLADMEDYLRELIHLRYVEGLSYKEIGRLWNVSEQKAQQINAKALRKLRKLFLDRTDLLGDYRLIGFCLESRIQYDSPSSFTCKSPCGFRYVSAVTGIEYIMGDADG